MAKTKTPVGSDLSTVSDLSAVSLAPAPVVSDVLVQVRARAEDQQTPHGAVLENALLASGAEEERIELAEPTPDAHRQADGLGPSCDVDALGTLEDLDDAAVLGKLVDVAVGTLSDHEIVLGADVLAPQVLADAKQGSLVKSDPLTVYMHEIRRYPLLDRDEEHRLAVEYEKTRNPAIGRRLITANLRLVVKIAHEYKRAYRNILDLVQEGNLGLLQAVEKYDPHRGVKLSSYAAWWIRAYMIKFILNNWRLVKIGTTQAQRKLFFNLSKARDKLEAEGFAPTSKLLAERLSVPEREVTDMSARLGHSEESLDAPVGLGDEAGRHKVDLLESPEETRPDVAAEGEEFRALLQQKLSAFDQTLSGRDKLLFRDRLMSEQPLTLQEVGDRFGISRERARQLEARLLGRLKDYLKKELGDAVQIATNLD